MIDRRSFTGMLIGGAAASAVKPAHASQSTANARRDEVAALREFAERTHPRGREAQADSEWQRRWGGLERTAETLSDGAYFLQTRRALGWFEDGHTTVLPFEFVGGIPEALKNGPFGLTLPFRVRVFDDGAFVTSTTKATSYLANAKVEKVGMLTAAQLIQAAAKDWPGNKAWAQRWAGYPFSRPALLQGLGACTDPAAPVAINMVDRGSARTSRITPLRSTDLALEEAKRTSPRSEQMAQIARTKNFVVEIPEASAIYLRIDEMADVEGKAFEALTRECIGVFAEPRFERLVIDLRLNGGGNNYLGEPLRRIIATSRFNRSGQLYVLTGPRTFSAAQNFAGRLERETFALFVGLPTGGQPNHYGDAAPFTGKATGLFSIISTIPWFDSYPQDKRRWIMPDLLVPELFADWQSGRDPTLELALSHKPDAVIDDLHRDRVFFYSRKSQSAEWHPFWDMVS